MSEITSIGNRSEVTQTLNRRIEASAGDLYLIKVKRRYVLARDGSMVKGFTFERVRVSELCSSTG